MQNIEWPQGKKDLQLIKRYRGARICPVFLNDFKVRDNGSGFYRAFQADRLEVIGSAKPVMQSKIFGVLGFEPRISRSQSERVAATLHPVLIGTLTLRVRVN